MSRIKVSRYLGLDLGSTTTKAILIDSSARIVGRGMVRSKGDYETALAIATERAERDARAQDGMDIAIVKKLGTGYGRLTLPFEKNQIRSEILCHGRGAHHLFGKTRTVLDIGGQDMKAIQVDSKGRVRSFQMNDRCAAGCGRYLGYIAEEMRIPLSELGPMAMEANQPTQINSTCTVFAGAEVRERLNCGERREDILGGLHRAILLRAISLLSRSGGVRSELTFSGGVAKNQAAVHVLRELVRENFGEMVVNIAPDSIYMGALGAALFAREEEGSS